MTSEQREEIRQKAREFVSNRNLAELQGKFHIEEALITFAESLSSEAAAPAGGDGAQWRAEPLMCDCKRVTGIHKFDDDCQNFATQQWKAGGACGKPWPGLPSAPDADTRFDNTLREIAQSLSRDHWTRIESELRRRLLPTLQAAMKATGCDERDCAAREERREMANEMKTLQEMSGEELLTAYDSECVDGEAPPFREKTIRAELLCRLAQPEPAESAEAFWPKWAVENNGKPLWMFAEAYAAPLLQQLQAAEARAEKAELESHESYLRLGTLTEDYNNLMVKFQKAESGIPEGRAENP